MPDYTVQTNIYNGPMDLLLYLIRRNEVDLYDIPLARITEQYCRYVELLSAIDPNVAGDFLVMAATLMEMKSRMLLPRPVAEEGELEDLSDPRLELVRQLLEYKKFKDASFELAAAAEAQAMRWPRTPAKAGEGDPAEVDLDEVQVWDLVGAFTRLMSSIGGGKVTHDVVFDDTPIALHAADLLERLQSAGGQMSFEDIFAGRTKVEMIGLFLSLLELMRQQRVLVTQAGMFAPIKITLLSAEPIEVGEEWEPALRQAVLGAAWKTDERPAHEPASALDEAPEQAEALAGEEALDDELAGFEELERIKTDVDIDAILKQPAAGRSSESGDAEAERGRARDEQDAEKGLP